MILNQFFFLFQMLVWSILVSASQAQLTGEDLDIEGLKEKAAKSKTHVIALALAFSLALAIIVNYDHKWQHKMTLEAS